jgi:hypothetical protein
MVCHGPRITATMATLAHQALERPAVVPGRNSMTARILFGDGSQKPVAAASHGADLALPARCVNPDRCQ